MLGTVKYRIQCQFQQIEGMKHRILFYFYKKKNRGICINYIVFIMYIYTKVINACFTGGVGNVYKGSLADVTLVAVKKLDKVLPHGEKEFITAVNTIGSMHHMNLVWLCGYFLRGHKGMYHFVTF